MIQSHTSRNDEASYCPNCFQLIDKLLVESDVRLYQTEYGYADISFELYDTYNTDIYDSETNEERYICPKCEGGIGYDDLMTEEDAKEAKKNSDDYETIDTADNYNKNNLE